MAQINCRYFSGYKPCGFSETCDENCCFRNIPKSHLLIVHLEALGAVLRSTSLLPAIKRKFPGCHITWVTKSPAQALLENNPFIDRVLTTSPGDLLKLKSLEFDWGFCIDKSLEAVGVFGHTTCDKVTGFVAESRGGAILPATEAAQELWELGLSNEKKFFGNSKPETQLVHEALELGSYQRDEYSLVLSEKEQIKSACRRSTWLESRPNQRGFQWIVGLNTGCSSVLPYKKLSIEGHRKLITDLLKISGVRVVLLGGREDQNRNQKIAEGLDVIQSPTNQGLRDGLTSVEACDVIVTGDSLGMHMGIALKKWVVAWFGPTCAHEIDLFGRGRSILTRAQCGPCWKRQCQKDPMCFDQVDLGEIVDGVREGLSLEPLPSLSSQL